MSLKTKINASIQIVDTRSPDGGATRVDQLVSKAIELLNGTTNDKADLYFVDNRTLASNTPETLDLAGSLVNANGDTLTIAELCALLIVSDPANTTDLTIGGATAEAQLFFAAAGDKAVIKPGGCLLAFAPAGWTITATTADGLKIANGTGASAAYSIAAIGRSA